MLETDFDPARIATERIPPGLDEMAPGPVLAGFLSAIDVTTVSGYDRVVVLRAHQRMASHYQAHTYTDMAAITQAFAEGGDAGEVDLGAAEIRVALNLTRRAADTELSFALDLKQRLPKVHALLTNGLIDVRRARTIDHETSHLTTATARGVVERIAEAAPGLTTGQLRARIKKLCIQTDTEQAKKRYQQAVEGRRVIAEPTSDGTADLMGMDLPPHKVAAVTRRINTIARSLRGGGETRTMDQLRADIYLDLLQGTNHTTRPNGVIHMTVDLDTLTGLTNHPGELNGFTPVIADIARQTATDQTEAEWRYTVTNTQTGQALNSGTTRRRPTTALRRTVETRDQTCVFPGCRMPATDCDLDHTTTWAEGGPTTPDNLAPMCRPDHQLRHNGWAYIALPDGSHKITSPLGHTYTTWRDPP